MIRTKSSSEISASQQNVNAETHALEQLLRSASDSAAKSLSEQVPTKQESSIPSGKSSPASIIEQANDKTQDSILALIAKNESARVKRQKPVLTWVLRFVGVQLVAFNVIIGGVIWFAIHASEVGNFSLVLDFLKYYIGAVLVEMIGMIVFITKSTFTSSTSEMLNAIKTLLTKEKT